MKLDKEMRPWLEYFGDIPANIEYPDYAMVDQLIASAEKWPDNVALSYYGSKTTYRELVEKVKECARALKNYGVQKEDKVTI